MKKVMRDSAAAEEVMHQQLSERTELGNRLVEKWAKTDIGKMGKGLDSLMEANPTKARNTAIILENERRHLKGLTETQISNSFGNGMIPQNVMKILRLSYPNSVRGDIFTEWAMETAKDSIFYLTSVYGQSKRGATSGTRIVESFADRYASETEEVSASTADNKTYTVTLSPAPLRPFTVLVLAGTSAGTMIPVGRDDGNGNITGTGITAGTSSVVDYTSGVTSVLFAAVDVTRNVVIQYAYDSEQFSLYDEIGDIQLELRDHIFRARQFPLGVSWSKMTELLLDTTLGIDAEEALLQGAADELKKSLDYFALRLGYRYSLGNQLVTHNANFALAGADSELAHAQSAMKVIDQAGDIIYNAIGRGGVTNIYGGTAAINYLKLHNRFTDAGKQPRIGAHKVGSIDGIGIYKVPNNIVPADELVCSWKNENVDQDSAILFGTLIPLYSTQKLEFKELYTEQGLAHYGDFKATNPNYLVRVKMNGLSQTTA